MSDNKNHVAPPEVGAAIDYFNAEFREESTTRRHFDVLIEWITELRGRLLSVAYRHDPHGTLRETVTCPDCGGMTLNDPLHECKTCDGTGRRVKP